MPAAPDTLDDLLAAYTPALPGLAVLVARGDDVIFERYLGAANLEYDAPVTAETRFHVASVSKQFTAFAALQLATDGKLGLTDDIRAHLPLLADYGDVVTVADLVHHTGGLRDQWELLMMSGTPLGGAISQRAIIQIAQRQRGLNFPPGTDIRYSNAGYSLLAEIVAKAGGQPFRQHLDKQIFAPLGMTQTLVYDNAAEVLPGRAMSYALPAAGAPVRQARLNYSNYGATSLHTTPRDLLKWSRELLHPTVFGAEMIAAARTPGRLRDGRPHNYAFGMIPDTIGGLNALTHGGADAGYRAFFASFPDQDACIVVLSNGSADVGKLGLALAQRYLGATSEPTAPPAPGAAEALAGYYINDWGPGMTLEAKDGALHATIGGAAIGDVSFRPDGSFYLLSPANSFVPLPGGDLAARQMIGGLDLIHRRADRAAPSPTDLAALAGDYRSDELDVTYTLSADGAGLTLTSLRGGPVTLAPADTDAFDGLSLRLRLVRGPTSAVTGITAATGRIRDLPFHRVR